MAWPITPRLVHLLLLLALLTLPSYGSVTHRFTSRNAQQLFNNALVERQLEGDDAAVADAAEAQALAYGELVSCMHCSSV